MKTIKISEETYEKIKDQLLEDEGKKTESFSDKLLKACKDGIIFEEEGKKIESFSDMIGGKYFFRTVTYFVLGKVKKQIGQFFELEGASWIPDTGRFMDFLKRGKLDEVEPTGKHYVNIEMIVDFFEWEHELPKAQL